MSTKTKEPTQAELEAAEQQAQRDALIAKERRGRDLLDEKVHRVRPDHPERPPEEPVDKRAWKEARNRMPGPITVDKQRPEPVKVEPPRERTPEEIAAKAERGLVRYPEHGSPNDEEEE